jgi:hypothetical protein
MEVVGNEIETRIASDRAPIMAPKREDEGLNGQKIENRNGTGSRPVRYYDTPQTYDRNDQYRSRLTMQV